MKDIVMELREEYAVKFTSCLKAAELMEKIDQEIFMAIMKKAAGCKLMLDEYDRQLSLLGK